MTHQHHHPKTDFSKAFMVAIALNLAFVIIEAIYAYAANSASLLADAGHNLGDVLGLSLAWLASWLLTKPATQLYSYGFKRTSILAALINSLILVFTSSIIAVESIEKFIHPTPVHEMTIILVALVGIAINGGTAILFIRGRHSDLNIKGAFLHLAYDTLISIGVVVTGILIYFTDLEWLDPTAGILIVVMILLGTWSLLRDSVNLILDAVPHFIDKAGVKKYLCGIDGVVAMHDLHIWGLSTQDAALTVHLIMPDKPLDDAAHKKITTDLHEQFSINHVTIQVEKGSDHFPCDQLHACKVDDDE